MKQLIKKLKTSEMVKLVTFANEKNINIEETFINLDEKSAELLVKFMLDLKMDKIKKGILKVADYNYTAFNSSERNAYIEKMENKIKWLNKIIPFVKDLTVDRLYGILLASLGTPVDILYKFDWDSTMRWCVFTFKTMANRLDLKTFDDTIPPLTDKQISELWKGYNVEDAD